MPDEDLEQLREIMRLLGESLPGFVKSLSDLAFDPKRVSAFAASTADFYKQLKDAGMSDEKAAELTKAFMERANPFGGLQDVFRGAPGDIFGGSGRGRGRGSMVFRIGRDPDEEAGPSKDADAPEEGERRSKP